MTESEAYSSKGKIFTENFSITEEIRLRRLMKKSNKLHQPQNYLNKEQVDALRLETPTVKIDNLTEAIQAAQTRLIKFLGPLEEKQELLLSPDRIFIVQPEDIHYFLEVIEGFKQQESELMARFQKLMETPKLETRGTTLLGVMLLTAQEFTTEKLETTRRLAKTSFVLAHINEEAEEMREIIALQLEDPALLNQWYYLLSNKENGRPIDEFSLEQLTSFYYQAIIIHEWLHVFDRYFIRETSDNTLEAVTDHLTAHIMLQNRTQAESLLILAIISSSRFYQKIAQDVLKTVGSTKKLARILKTGKPTIKEKIKLRQIDRKWGDKIIQA